jgi:hypothetical protein
MQPIRCAGVLAALAALVPLGLESAQAPAPAIPFDLQVTPVTSPASGQSGEPQLSTSDRGVLMSWIERDGATAILKFAERAGDGWSEPRVVASGDDWFVNWADVPSVMRLDDGTLVAHWLQKSGPGTYAYDVRLSHSADDGRTWAESFTPHHDGTETEHGFASLFQMPGAGLGLVWLDGRQMAAEPSGDAAGEPGAMTLRFATFDREWRQTSEMPIDLRVCECCPTTAAVTSDGVITAYRDRSDEEIRDIYVARFEDGAWAEPRAVHDDRWQINGCPVNGPMLSARGRQVAIAWFHAKERQGHVFVAFSEDAGRTFGPPVRVDDQAAQGRVDVELLADGSALASWIEYADQQATFRVRRIEASGARSAAVTVAPLVASRASGYPRVALHGSELVFAWTDSTGPEAGRGGGTRRVATATATLPPAPGR